VWKSADPKKKYEWTSLMGGEKHKLLKKLPEQFHKILPQDKAPAVQKLWNVSNMIFNNNIAPVQGFVPLTEQISNSYQIFYLPGVEKKNDDIRRFFHRKINRWDASTSVLLVEKRQEDLGGYERQPRKYMKKNEAFWCNGGKQQIARDYPRISTQTTQPRED